MPRAPKIRGDGLVRPYPADAYALARRKYLAGERVELGQIAEELGVNRVTLYRWVGSRDALLVSVIWTLTEQTLEQEWAKLEDRDGPRVPALLGGYLRATQSQLGSRRFLQEENERAMRLFTLAANDFQPRFVAAVRAYLAMDVAEGRITSSLSLDDLAYATVRIAESYQYLPTIIGAPADPDGAERVLEGLLGD